MNIKYYISLENYISSPITLFHAINYKIKVIIIFTILSFIPYLNFNNYSIILIFFFILQMILINRSIEIVNIVKGLSVISLYLVYVVLLSYSINFTNQTKINMHICSIHLPYYINFFRWNKANRICYQIIIKYLIYYTPAYIIKIAIINILSVILIYMLSICTKHEMISYGLINILIKASNLKFYSFNKYIMTILISCQFLEKVIENISSLLLAIKIKNNLCSKRIIYYLFSSGKKYLINSIEDHNYTSLTFWIRDINKNTYRTHI